MARLAAVLARSSRSIANGNLSGNDPDIDLAIICQQLAQELTQPLKIHTISVTSQSGANRVQLRHQVYASTVAPLYMPQELSEPHELAALYAEPLVVHLVYCYDSWHAVLYEAKEAQPALATLHLALNNAVPALLPQSGQVAAQDDSKQAECIAAKFHTVRIATFIEQGKCLLQAQPGNFNALLKLGEHAIALHKQLDDFKELLACKVASAKLVNSQGAANEQKALVEIAEFQRLGAELLWQRRRNFFQELAHASSAAVNEIIDFKLYNNVLLTPEDATRHYRKVARYCHPDAYKAQRLYWPVPEASKAALIDELEIVFAAINNHHALQQVKPSNDVNDRERDNMAAKDAQDFWDQGAELLELFKSKERELAAARSDAAAIANLTAQLQVLKQQMKKQFSMARDKYRISCCAVDKMQSIESQGVIKQQLLTRQVELRQQIARCCAYSGEVLETHLYALGALQLLEQELVAMDPASKQAQMDHERHQAELQAQYRAATTAYQEHQATLHKQQELITAAYKEQQETLQKQQAGWQQAIDMQLQAAAPMQALFQEQLEELQQDQVTAAKEYEQRLEALQQEQVAATAAHEQRLEALQQEQGIAAKAYEQRQAAWQQDQVTAAKAYEQRQAELRYKQFLAATKAAVQQQAELPPLAAADMQRYQSLQQQLVVANQLLNELQQEAWRIGSPSNEQMARQAPPDQSSLTVTVQTPLLAAYDDRVISDSPTNVVAPSPAIKAQIVPLNNSLVLFDIPQPEVVASQVYYANLVKKADNYAVGMQVSGSCGVIGFLMSGAGLYCALGLSATLGAAITLPVGAIMMILGSLLAYKSADATAILIKEAKKIDAKLKVWEQLNNITQDAYKHYQHHEYSCCLEKLATIYEDGRTKCQLLSLDELNTVFDCNKFVTALLNNGFRPDAVAAWVLLVAEVLLNYHDQVAKARNLQGKVVRFPADIFAIAGRASSITERDRCALAMQAWRALLMNHELPAAVTSWEQRLLIPSEPCVEAVLSWLPWLRHNKAELAAVHQHDAATMSLQTRLQELHNLAKINMALVILRNQLPCADEREQALNLYGQVRSAIDASGYFLLDGNRRLHTLEDFFVTLFDLAKLEEATNKVKCDKQLAGSDVVRSVAIAASADVINVNEINNYKHDIAAAQQRLATAQDETRKLGYLDMKSLLQWQEAAAYYEKALASCDKHYHTKPAAVWLNLLLASPRVIAEYGSCLLALCLYEQLETWLKAQLKFLEINSAATIKALGLQEQRQALAQFTLDYLVLGSILERKRCRYFAASNKLNIAAELDHKDVGVLKEQQLLAALYRSKTEAQQQEALHWDAGAISSARQPYYSVLALDGASFCGSLAPALMLRELEKKLRRPIASLFNEVVAVGSSAYLAAGLVLPAAEQQRLPLYSAAAMVSLYENAITTQQQQLVTSSWWQRMKGYEYANYGYQQFFSNYFPKQQLGRSLINLGLPLRRVNFFAGAAVQVCIESSSAANVEVATALWAATAPPRFFAARRLGLANELGAKYCSVAAHCHAGVVAYDLVTKRDAAANMFMLSLGNLKAIAEFKEAESADDEYMRTKLGKSYQRWQFMGAESVAVAAGDVTYASELVAQQFEELAQSDDNRFNCLLEKLELQEELAEKQLLAKAGK